MTPYERRRLARHLQDAARAHAARAVRDPARGPEFWALAADAQEMAAALLGFPQEQQYDRKKEVYSTAN